MLDAAEKGRLAKTHWATCKYGHALTADNIYVRPDNGKRMCLTCHRARARRWREDHPYIPKAMRDAAERLGRALEGVG
jgi:hypothetical protein